MLARRQLAPGGIVMIALCIRPAATCLSCKDRVLRSEKARNMSMYWNSLRSSSVRVPAKESHQKPTKSCTCDPALSLICLNVTPQTSSAHAWNVTTRRVTALALGPVAHRSST